MVAIKKEPNRRVYRYRQINEKTIDMLILDEVYFAHPSSFNDPLDCKPTIDVDSTNDNLKEILRYLVGTRVQRETEILLKKIKLKSDKVTDFAKNRANAEAKKELSNLNYYASDPAYEDIDDPVRYLLKYQIQIEILKHYERGVCCFSRTYNNPVLWSHYGDQHRGICIVYDTNRNPKPKLHPVEYGGERNIKTSLIYDALISKENTALLDLEKSILLRKAKEWRYERELRIIDEVGCAESPLRMREIIFGMRSPTTMKHTIVKAMGERVNEIKFSEIFVSESYKLQKRPLEMEEIAFLPKIAVSVQEAFGQMDIIE